MSVDVLHLDIEHLKEFYLFANTPNYLFQNFQRTPSIATLAEQSSTQELIEEIKLRSSQIESLKDLVLVYAFLVGLGFKPCNELTELHNLQLSVDWFPEIKELVFEHADDRQILCQTYRPKFLGDRAAKLDPSNTTGIEVTLRPHVEHQKI